MKIEISDSLILWGIIGMLAFTGCTYTAPIARGYRVTKVERQVPDTVVYNEERPQQTVVVQQPVYTARPRYYGYNYGTTVFVEGGYNYGFGFGGMPPRRPYYGEPIIPHIGIEPEHGHGGHGGRPHDGGRGEHGRGFEPDQGGSSGGRIIYNGGIGPNAAARYNDGLTAGERLGNTMKKGSSGKMPNPTAGSELRNTVKGYENRTQRYGWKEKYMDEPVRMIDGFKTDVKAKHNNALDVVIYGVNENVR